MFFRTAIVLAVALAMFCAGASLSLPKAAAKSGVKSGAPASVAAGPVEQGLLLKQHSGFVAKYISRVTAHGVRVEDVAGEFYIVCSAPDWTVYVVRPKTKEMSVVSHHDWCYKHQIHALSWTSALIKPLGVTRATQEGLPTVTYRYGATEAFGPTLKMTSDLNFEQKTNLPNHAEIICLDYPGSDKTGPIMGRFRGLPPIAGLVLKAYRIEKNGTTAAAIDTDNIDAKVKIAKSVFLPPKGYKIVAFTLSMVQSAAATENSRALLEDFMGK